MQISIEPKSSFGFIDWKFVLQYRDLLLLWAKRDIVSKYRQTFLGPLWFIIQPLSAALVFVLIFSKGLNISTEGVPPALFYLIGLMVWNYVSQCLNSISMTLVANSGLFKKVFFPRIILPLSYCFSSLVSMAIQFGVVGFFYLVFRFKGSLISPGFFIFWLPVLTLHLMVLALGLGLWLAALSVRYRDFHHVWNLLSPLWLYATPISYPLSAIPKEWKWIIELNPLTAIVEGFRLGLLNVGEFDSTEWLVSFIVTLIIVVSGVVLFQIAERDCVDSL